MMAITDIGTSRIYLSIEHSWEDEKDIGVRKWDETIDIYIYVYNV